MLTIDRITHTITLPVFNVRITTPVFALLLVLAALETAVEIALVIRAVA